MIDGSDFPDDEYYDDGVNDWYLGDPDEDYPRGE
jgi:hypothetical protein